MWEQEERKPNYEDRLEERLLYYTAHQKTLKGKTTVFHSKYSKKIVP